MIISKKKMIRQLEMAHMLIKNSKHGTYEHGRIRGVESTLEWLLGARDIPPFWIEEKHLPYFIDSLKNQS